MKTNWTPSTSAKSTAPMHVLDVTVTVPSRHDGKKSLIQFYKRIMSGTLSKGKPQTAFRNSALWWPGRNRNGLRATPTQPPLTQQPPSRQSHTLPLLHPPRLKAAIISITAIVSLAACEQPLTSQLKLKAIVAHQHKLNVILSDLKMDCDSSVEATLKFREDSLLAELAKAKELAREGKEGAEKTKGTSGTTHKSALAHPAHHAHSQAGHHHKGAQPK